MERNIKTNKLDKIDRLEFVEILKNHPVLLNKSLQPQIQKQKENATNVMINELYKKTAIKINTEQLKKKINNMKNEIKKKTQKKNKNLILKAWETDFLELIQHNSSQSNTSQTEVARFRGPLPIIKKEIVQSDEVVEEAVSSAKKRKTYNHLSGETDEIVEMTDGQLSRLILLRQLEVLDLQKEKYILEISNLRSSVGSRIQAIDLDSFEGNENKCKKKATSTAKDGKS